MVTAVVPNAEELIAARRSAGLDRADEIIKGVYYMVPPGTSAHGRRQVALGAHLLSQGLVVASEAGVGFPNDYVIPDLVVYRDEPAADTVYADPGSILFVVEIRSDSNVGTHWDAKLARLGDWGVPVVIFDGDELTNRLELSQRIVEFFDAS